MFTVNDAPKKLIEALKKDPSRVESYLWESLYRDVYDTGNYWDKRYLTKEKAKITTEHYVTKIAILELTGEDEPKDKVPSVSQLTAPHYHHGAGQAQSTAHLYQNIATASQAQYNAAQAQYNAAQAQYNAIGQAQAAADAHNIYGNTTQGII